MLCYCFHHFIDGEAAVQGSLSNQTQLNWLVSAELGF